MSDQLSNTPDTSVTGTPATEPKAKRVRKPKAAPTPSETIYFDKETDDALRAAGKDPERLHGLVAAKTGSGQLTKKAVVIEMISRPQGATHNEIAAAIVARGLDDDIAKNKRVAALWIPKCDIPYRRSGSRGNYRYFADLSK